MSDGGRDLRPWKPWAMWLIAAHTAVVAVHSLAHVSIGVLPTSAIDNTIIVPCYYAGPIAAAYAISKGKWNGPLLLLGSMMAGFGYGFISHFVVDSADHVWAVSWQGWGLAFGTTSVVLAVLEAELSFIGWRLISARRALCPGEATAPTL